MKRCLLFLFPLTLLLAGSASGQMLRYDQHREIEPPEYADLRIGPFFSNLAFSQTAGFRYTTSEGTGTDFLFGNNRGIIKEEGWEYPLVSTITAQNYLLISDHTDLDISFSMGYAQYPMGTQEDEFYFDLAEEGVSGLLSMEFYLTRFIRGRLSDDIYYRTDYVDLRGIEDEFGGLSYEHLQNTLTLDLDWLMDVDKNLGGSVARTDVVVMDDNFEEQERSTWDEQLYYEQQLTAFLVGGARAGFNQTEYTVDERAGSAMQNYTLYSRAKLTQNTQAGVEAGVSQGTSDDLASGSTDSFSGSASLDTQLSEQLSHGFSYTYGLRGGFSAPFDRYSTFGYRAEYGGELSSVSFVTSYSSVEPLVEDLNEYADWMSALNLVLPMTRHINLLCTAEYSVRENGEAGDAELSDPEYNSDYETMSLRAGTSFSVTRKINFEIYAQRIDRTSDSPDLEYSRDIFAGTFTYSHSF